MKNEAVIPYSDNSSMMAGTPNFGPKRPPEITTGRRAFSGSRKIHDVSASRSKLSTAAHRVRDVGDHVEGFDLGMLEHVLDRTRHGAGHVRRTQERLPLLRALSLQ